VFDEDHLVSRSGLLPVMALAAHTGLMELLDNKIHIADSRIASGSANPAPKLAMVIAGMCVGADSIDDLDAVRSGGMKALFDGVFAPSILGTLLREFTFGHSGQLDSVLESLLRPAELLRMSSRHASQTPSVETIIASTSVSGKPGTGQFTDRGG
jgi:hypothetical protein